MANPFKRIKQKYLLKNLRSRKHLKEIKNMDQVRTIGIVFHLGDELSWKYLYAIVMELEHSNRRVHMICDQVNGQEMTYIITHSQTTICHEKEDFDMWGVPHDSSTENFLTRKYDVLIDVTGGDSFFSQYMVLKADADLNITYIDDSDKPSEIVMDMYDMTIHGNGPIDLPAFFENVCNYLQMVRK
ncbi:MAG: hypothetical protein K5867_08195 [Bacteroidales bacterium]|nr:hypothetical protein [Bacteroidales bacterium]